MFTDFKQQRIEGPGSTVWKVGNACKTETVWTAVRLNKQNDNFCTRKWLVIAECLKVPFHFLCVLLRELSAVSIFRDHPPPSANIHSKQLKSHVRRWCGYPSAGQWLYSKSCQSWLKHLTATADYTPFCLGVSPSCLVLPHLPPPKQLLARWGLTREAVPKTWEDKLSWFNIGFPYSWWGQAFYVDMYVYEFIYYLFYYICY